MTQAQHPEALRLADALAYCDSSVASQAARELRAQHARIAELEAQLVTEAARTAAEKLRADQMSQQHDDQAALNREAREQLATLKAAPAAVAAPAADAATQAAQVAAKEPAPITFMTVDQASKWGWDDVRKEVGTEGWTVMDSVNYHGFFLWGWNYRGQYELQRAATRSAVMQELTAAPAASAPQAQDVQRDAARVSLPIHWMKELVALCGPEDHELRDRVLKSLERLPLAHAGKLDELNKGEVLVVVTGYTGTGKSAVAGEIEIMCRALGLEVEWPGGDSEKNMTHADWTAALEQYRPRVRIVERNVPGPIAAQAAQGEA